MADSVVDGAQYARTEMAMTAVKTNCTLNTPVLSARKPGRIRPMIDEALMIEMR